MRSMKSFMLMALLGTVTLYAQKPSHTQYVTDTPSGGKWYTAYSNWKPGTALYNTYTNYDDEEFFISRVKPRERFTNANTQVRPTLNSNRKMLWWCPIGTVGWNAVPNYFFDSEVFTMWSYLDIYGNWTASLIRMPGAFADVCHKNGVPTTTLAAVGWASTVEANDGGNGSNMNAMIKGGADKLLKYLRYYGVDGIGYNSEFNIGSSLSAASLKGLFGDCYAKAASYGWDFHNVWYSQMYNGGSVGGPDYLSSSNQDWFNYNGKTTSDAYFMNYNWGDAALGESQTAATSLKRSSFDVYAGMDFQGRSTAAWTALKNYDISVGMWGAHDMNMMFEGRGELGSSALQHQKTYQLISENVFTGSSFNPVNTPAISDKLAHTASEKSFHGISSFITARSALQTTDLAKEPFVTYFNLGNGQFYNVKGKREFPNQWYNIGVQDYMPTWRWWWTSSFMGRTAADVPASGLTAAFTWEDSWMGGSCLSISGKTNAEYLQLFKMKYPVTTGDKLLIRYKVLGGSGTMKWACSAEGDEATEVGATISSTLAPTDDGAWQETTVDVGTARTNLKLADKTLALMGLKFENTTSDFSILIGEISLTRGAAPTPAKPTLVKEKMLASSYLGADLKVIFKMKDVDAAHPELPIYNSDVNAWYYKVYTQQQDGEPVMCTTTTSWAAYIVGAPLNLELDPKMRVGVSAVSIDGRTESEIAWSDYMDVPEFTLVNGVEIDKNIIKAGEDFTVKFKDPNQSSAKWEILNAQTDHVVATKTSTTSITTHLSDVGIYDLLVTRSAKDSTLYQGLIQVSPDEVGAIPQIQSLKANGSDTSVTVKEKEPVILSYTGRPADGKVSRGLKLQEKAFGVPCNQLGFTTSQPFTISFWFNPIRFNHGASGTQLLNIRTADDAWPASDWGFIWSTIGTDNKFSLSFRRTINAGTQIDVPNFTFAPGQWYHFSLVADFKSGSRVVTLYINGRKIKTAPSFNDLYSWSNTNVIMIGGRAFNRSGLDGFLDEFQLYNHALSQTEVIASMQHLNTIPAGLIGYWDFESDVAADGYIYSTGTNKALKGGTVDSRTASEGVNTYPLITSVFGTGAPFIAGSNYTVTTQPSWTFGKNASLSAASGSDKSGSATVSYGTNGVYTAALTLSNGWGSDTKTFSYIKVGTTGIDDAHLQDAFNASPNPFTGSVNVRFAKEGNYGVYIYDINGKQLSHQTTRVMAGEVLSLGVDAPAGTYLLRIISEGKTLSAIKLIKK